MAESNYYFREDVEAEKDRQAQTGPATLAPPPAPGAPQPTAAPAGNAFADLGKVMATTAAPKPAAAKPDYFADFRASLEAQDPFRQQLQGAVTDTLKNPTAAFDAQASAERDRQAREASAAKEEQRQAAVLAYGGNQTGQVDRAMGVFNDKNTLREAEFGRDVAAGRASAAETARANALGQGTALLGEGRNAAAQAADIGLRQSGQEAEIAVADKQLAENARQFNTRQEFETWATKEGWKQDAITRAWQSSENAKAQGTSKEIAFAQIGSAERMQQSAQVWEGTQADLNRSLETLLSNDRIKASFTLAEMDAELQERMQATGFLNTKELEVMRGDLEERLQAKGFDQETATLIAQQKFTEMEANRDRLHDEAMTNLKQTWASGERIETQVWDSTMRDLDRRQEDLLTRLQVASQEGMNTERIQAEISENAKARASTEMMAAAQLAMTDKNFQAELEQRYQFSAEDLEIRKQELGAQLELMGLQGDQLKAAIGDQKVASAMNIVALGLEIGDGSPESMAPFVEQFGSALETYMKAQGIDIASSDFVKAMTPQPGTGGASGTGGTTGGAITPSADTLQDALGLASEIAGAPGQHLANFIRGVADAGNSPKAIKTFSEIIASATYNAPPAKAMGALTAYLGAPAIIAVIGEAEYNRIMGMG
jgi:hypothetical protein